MGILRLIYSWIPLILHRSCNLSAEVVTPSANLTGIIFIFNVIFCPWLIIDLKGTEFLKILIFL